MTEHRQYNLERPLAPAQETQSPNVHRIDKNLIVKNFFEVNNNETTMRRGQRFARTVVSAAAYSAAATDYLIGVTSLVLAPTIGLPRPSLVGAGKTYIVKDEAGGAGTTTITIRSVGEETIDGASTATITTNYGSKSFYASGANWFTY